MIRVILASLLLGFFTTQIEARTIRYEFDVVDSSIGYQSLQKIQDSTEYVNESIASGTAEYDAFVAKFHPLGGALGASGAVTLEIVENSFSNPNRFHGDLTCVSGFLCPNNAFRGAKVHSDSISILSGFEAFPGADEWSMGGELSYFGDGEILGNGNLGDSQYLWWAPVATFTLADFTITEVPAAPTPVPLPATAWLLGLGLTALGLTRRRRHAA